MPHRSPPDVTMAPSARSPWAADQARALKARLREALSSGLLHRQSTARGLAGALPESPPSTGLHAAPRSPVPADAPVSLAFQVLTAGITPRKAHRGGEGTTGGG